MDHLVMGRVPFLSVFVAILLVSSSLKPAGSTPEDQIQTSKIGLFQGGFVGDIYASSFGSAVVPVGDLDGDGIVDLAVGASTDDDGGPSHGAVWILFLDRAGRVGSFQKISERSGGFEGVLDDADSFGSTLTPLGDLDGDGVADLAVGSAATELSEGEGTVWILFLREDGTVLSHQKIGVSAGGFSGNLQPGDRFGAALSSLGDLTGDGNLELAVGAPGDDDGGTDRGAIWILSLDALGIVQREQKISVLEGDFTGVLRDFDEFGGAVTHLGDLDGDGASDIAVSAQRDDDGGVNRGAVWILNLQSDGTVRSQSKISNLVGNFRGILQDQDRFGSSLSAGDIDENGTVDLLVGVDNDRQVDFGAGAVWALFLDSSGTVLSHQKIIEGQDSFRVNLGTLDRFGASVAWLGDLDGNGVSDWAVGASGSGSQFTGALYLLFPPPRFGRFIDRFASIDGTTGNPAPGLSNEDRFGSATAFLGDLDGDGRVELLVGARGSGGLGIDRGAVWIVSLDEQGVAHQPRRIGEGQGGFTGPLTDGDEFGASAAAIGDLDGDLVLDVVVGASGDDDGGADRGAAWVLFLDPAGAVRSATKISSTAGGFGPGLADGDAFARSVTTLGDLDGDGVEDIAVGASRDDTGGEDAGAVWILFLKTDGTVRDRQKIASGVGGFTGTLGAADRFGIAVASPGDLDQDGIPDLAVGADGDDDGGPAFGSVWILFLESDGTVRQHQKISKTEGDFQGALNNLDLFGRSLAAVGDFDGDGTPDLLVGSDLDNHGGGALSTNRGGAWLLMLRPDGTVRSHHKIDDTESGFSPLLSPRDRVGESLTSIGDLDGDGFGDFALGAEGDDQGGTDRGSVYLLFTRGSMRNGNVNSQNGPVADGLLLDDSARDARIPVGQPFELSLLAPPQGPSNPKYFVFAWNGEPGRGVRLSGFGSTVGELVLPSPFHPFLEPQPFACLLGSGFPDSVCGEASRLNGPPRGPWALTRNGGFPSAMVVTLQGVVQDAGAVSPLGYSVTNAITVFAE